MIRELREVNAIKCRMPPPPERVRWATPTNELVEQNVQKQIIECKICKKDTPTLTTLLHEKKDLKGVNQWSKKQMKTEFKFANHKTVYN